MMDGVVSSTHFCVNCEDWQTALIVLARLMKPLAIHLLHVNAPERRSCVDLWSDLRFFEVITHDIV